MRQITKGLLLSFCLFSFACSGKKTKVLTIAASANMQFAIADMVAGFNNETGVACEVIVGSSGKLTAQILAGAPFDIFLSADKRYPMELFDNGLATSMPKVYAYGSLVMWGKIDTVSSIEVLLGDEIKHIAVANPKTAPYGEAAIAALKYHNIYHMVKGKLVYGESISQTNQFVTSGAAEIGFTAKSVVLTTNISGKGSWGEVNEGSYTPIAQSLVTLKSNPELLEESQLFLDFLFSEKGEKILNKFGYKVKG